MSLTTSGKCEQSASAAVVLIGASFVPPVNVTSLRFQPLFQHMVGIVKTMQKVGCMGVAQTDDVLMSEFPVYF